MNSGDTDTSNDFVEASEKTIHAVVHIKNMSVESRKNPTFFDFFYGYSTPKEKINIGTGSGVIISPDGFIITNNHVIENAEEIEITTNDNKTYQANVVGADPYTDIALLKIDADKKLQYLTFGDSDRTKIGEWVLAVGNPFNLTSTVTAGIISAKSRDLDPWDDKNQSFIQTDAAVNPGNSGGALVNTKGNLIGINTAITSYTGSYVGYSFAVPSNIAKKVVDDLIEFGNVRRGILGVRGNALDSETAKRLGLKETEGFYVSKIEDFAQGNQIKEGDIIKSINGITINRFSDLTGFLFSKRPGDMVEVKVLREGKEKIFRLRLLKNQLLQIPRLGVSVKNLSSTDKKRFSLKGGVKIVGFSNRMGRYGLEGKVIVGINNQKIRNVDDVKNILKNTSVRDAISITMIDKYGNRERFIVQ
ncbi:peptidase Do [Elysia marginata]|uniref:Peptidase Do n=1 Tax=Elysia marginata TaxID=1093978 RepID=A0AAV4EKE9_9GAST|nr:peptidase Do [Elysia marginata]